LAQAILAQEKYCFQVPQLNPFLASPQQVDMMRSVLTRLGNSKRKYERCPEAQAQIDAQKLKKDLKKNLKKIESKLKSPMPGVRQAAVLEIMEKDVPIYEQHQAFWLLSLGMEDSDSEVRRCAVRVLGKMIAQSYDKAIVSSHCGPCGLENQDIDARVAAARAMGRVVCPHDVKAMNMLAKCLMAETNVKVFEVATEVLCNIALRAYAKALQIISHGMKDSDADIRRDVVNLLGTMATRTNMKHLDILACGSNDEDLSVQFAAVKAKLKADSRGDETALQAFMAHTLENADVASRKIAMSVMSRAGTTKEDDPWQQFFSQNRSACCGGA